MSEIDDVHAEIQRHIANIERSTQRIPWIAALFLVAMLLWWVRP